MSEVNRTELTKFDCIALDEFNRAMKLKPPLPEAHLKALCDDLEFESRVRQTARQMVP